MGITEFLADIGGGIGAFLPELVKAMVEAFVGLFFTASEAGAINGLSAVGMVSLSFFVVGLSFKVVPTVASWLKLKIASKRKKRGN